jgi:flagellar motor switch protein FliM
MTQPIENNPGRAKIQQLLASIGSKQPDDSRDIEATDYDWHQPHFFNSQQMTKLTGFTAKAATLIADKLGTLCQRSFEVTITSTSEHFAGQFLGHDPSGKTQGPDNYYLPFSAGQEDPCGFVSISPQTAVIWTTQLLGDTESKENATRTLLSLEASFLFDMASLIVAALTEAGPGAPECSFRPAADAMTDHLPLQLNGAEEFCKITFQVKKAGSETASEAHILVLCEKLLPAVGDPSQTTGKFSPSDITAAIQNTIEKISVPITVQLAYVPVTVEQILNLAVCDILLLDKKVDEPVQLRVVGRTLCRGRCAKSAGNYAIAVTETFFETK